MKKALVIMALVILPVLACSQSRVDSPVTIEWEGESTSHEVAIQEYGGEVISLGITQDTEYYIDLEASEIYGLFVVMVRGVELTGPDLYSYSEWARSNTGTDVLQIDGEYQTFLIASKKPAQKPQMLRIK